VTVRVRPELREAIQQLAKRHGRSPSQEMQSALDYWVGRSLNNKTHIGALVHSVSLLVNGIEKLTGRRWIDDVFTGAAVRHAIEYFVLHFAPFSVDPPAVPSTVEKIAAKVPPSVRERERTPAGFGEYRATMLIAQIENAPAEDKPPLGLYFLDQRGFWKIRRDLGSGIDRNRKKLSVLGGA
jgi:hypothetical protein